MIEIAIAIVAALYTARVVTREVGRASEPAASSSPDAHEEASADAMAASAPVIADASSAATVERADGGSLIADETTEADAVADELAEQRAPDPIFAEPAEPPVTEIGPDPIVPLPSLEPAIRDEPGAIPSPLDALPEPAYPATDVARLETASVETRALDRPPMAPAFGRTGNAAPSAPPLEAPPLRAIPIEPDAVLYAYPIEDEEPAERGSAFFRLVGGILLFGILLGTAIIFAARSIARIFG